MDGRRPSCQHCIPHCQMRQGVQTQACSCGHTMTIVRHALPSTADTCPCKLHMHMRAEHANLYTATVERGGMLTHTHTYTHTYTHVYPGIVLFNVSTQTWNAEPGGRPTTRLTQRDCDRPVRSARQLSPACSMLPRWKASAERASHPSFPLPREHPFAP